MTKTKNRRWNLKSTFALLLAGVMLIGEAAGVGPADVSTVYAAEEETGITVTSMEYYDAAKEQRMELSGVTDATFGIVAPKFNGKDYKEIILTDVWSQLVIEEKQPDGTWMNIDKNVNPDSPYGWNEDWAFTLGNEWDNYVFWFRWDHSATIRIRSAADKTIALTYEFILNKLPTYEVTSMSAIGTTERIPDYSNSTSIQKNGDILYNGNASILYEQVADDIEVYVKREGESEFVPLLDNAEAGWIWDSNFGIDDYTWWFKEAASFKVSIRSISHPDVRVEYDVKYTEPDRSTIALTAAPGGTYFDVSGDATHTAATGLQLPYVNGGQAIQTDLNHFMYQVCVGATHIDGENWDTSNGVWTSMQDATSGWNYQGAGYSKYSDKQQWGYWEDHAYGLWFQPVKEDTYLRIAYVSDDETVSNYIYYTLIGDPQAVVPDLSDMKPITVDNKEGEEPTGDVSNDEVMVPEGWQMIWNDEFNGTELNENNWTRSEGYFSDPSNADTWGWGNKELEGYKDDEKYSSVDNGKLTLRMEKETTTWEAGDGRTADSIYTSGKVISQHKFSVKYGRVDFRAKLPDGDGIWPALWMMPNDDIYGTWASSGELDVFEGKGRTPNIAHGTLHFGGQWPGNLNTSETMDMESNVGSDMTNWHVYSVVWEEGDIKIYVDGICYFKREADSWSSAGAPSNPNAPFDQRFYLIMNLAAGGWFDELVEPNYETFTAEEMYVDYVRVYQKEVADGEDEKPDNEGIEDEWIGNGKMPGGKSDGKEDNLYGDYQIGTTIPATKVTVDKDTLTLEAGTSSEKLVTTLEPADSTDSVSWSSSDEEIATVKAGVVTALKPGTVTITAKARDGVEDTVNVTVTGTSVTGIELDKTTLELIAGNSDKITATITPADASNNNVVWSSSDEKIVKVDQKGNVTAVAVGTATITAKAEGGDFAATCTITVKPVAVTGMTLDKSNVTVEAGSAVKVTATVEPANASNKNVTWNSSDESVATVNNGTITGVSEGTTTITATTVDGNITATCNVTVTKKQVVLGEKGAKKDAEGNVILYVSNQASLGGLTAFRGIFSSQAEAEAVTVIDSRLGGYGMTLNADGVWEYNLGKLDDAQYLVYAFSGGIQETPIAIKVSDIPSEENGGSTEEKVTVTFNTDGGSSVASQEVVIGETATKPADPTKSGYKFAGWYHGDEEYDFNSAVNSDIILTAKWEADSTGGVELGEKGAKKDAEGNVILYVSNQASLGSLTAFRGIFSSLAEAEAVTVIDSRLGGYGMTLNADGIWEYNLGKLDDAQYLVYAFSGGIQETPIAIKVSDIPSEENGGSTEEKVTVTFNTDGGSAVASQEVVIGETATKPVDPTKSGYKFAGWYHGDEEYDFNSAVNSDIILTAKWEADNTDDGEEEETPVSVTDVSLNKSEITLEVGAIETLTATIEPENATDKDVTWTSTKTDVATVDNSGKVTAVAVGEANIVVTTADGKHTAICKVTVTAKENDGSTEEKVTVTFNTDGGSIVTSQEVVIGERATKPTDPTKSGYKFVGWYHGDEEYDFNSAVNSDITLTAKWEADNTDDGEEEETPVSVTGVKLNKSETTLEVGATESLIATIEPEGASNQNVTWTSTNEDVATVDNNGKVTAVAAGEAYIAVTTDENSFTETCKVTVTAKAEDNGSGNDGGSDTPATPETKSFKVTFDSVEGSAVTAQTVKEGEKAVKPEDPTRAGYKFLGWYAGETVYNFDTAVNADVTLTAKWEVIKITKVKITAISNKIAAGKKVQLKASLSPKDAVAKSVTWKLAKKSDSKYAKVTSKGKVTLKKNGAGKKVKVKATVTGLDGTVKSKTITITIKKHAVKKLSIKGSKTVNVKAGRSVSLKSRVKIVTTGSSVNKTLKWTTSNEAIATVSKSGKVKVSKTAKKGHKVTIKAQSTDGTNKKVTFTIKVK